MIPQQLTLGIQLRDEASFKNFYVSFSNQATFAYLKNFLNQRFDTVAYLWGAPQQGRSHLLQACCHQAEAQKLSVVYLPLDILKELNADMLQGLENYSLVCVDNVEMIAGKKMWEEEFFHFYNRLHQQKHYLLVTANCPPAELRLTLPDLKSRLTAATIFHLLSLTDDEKIMAIQLRAKQRGLELSEQAGKFLLHHWPRNNENLFNALEQLDNASLTAQRNLTIPFIKDVLKI